MTWSVAVRSRHRLHALMCPRTSCDQFRPLRRGAFPMTYTYDLAGNRLTSGGTLARTNLPPVLTATTYNANNQQSAFGASISNHKYRRTLQESRRYVVKHSRWEESARQDRSKCAYLSYGRPHCPRPSAMLTVKKSPGFHPANGWCPAASGPRTACCGGSH